MSEYVHIKRGFGPVYNRNSKILILGSFPSTKSREAEFYYAHPRNRFWPLMARIYNEALPLGNDEKRAFALKHNIALYDVIEECDIKSSSDSSIKNAMPVDIKKVLNETEINTIYCNGSISFELYNKLLLPLTGIEAIRLPSTSPANAAWSEEKLFEKWKIIKDNPGST